MSHCRLWCFLGLFVFASATHAEDYVWKKLATEAYRGKQDDIHFVTPLIGWYVNGSGKIFKTVDGGNTSLRQSFWFPAADWMKSSKRTNTIQRQ